jgi:hypothetical protein
LSVVGYLFENHREENYPYTLLIEGFEPEEGEPDDATLELRFHNLWEVFYRMNSVAEDDELGKFELKLGEPDHYERILRERKEEEGNNPSFNS